MMSTALCAVSSFKVNTDASQLILSVHCGVVLCYVVVCTHICSIQPDGKWTSDSGASQQAVRHNRLDVVAWLMSVSLLREPTGTTPLTTIAASENHLDMLQWLKEHGFQIDIDTCTAAVGHPDSLLMIQWIQSQRLLGDVWTIETLINRASSEAVRDWLQGVVDALRNVD
jgi:hypothetical protein